MGGDSEAAATGSVLLLLFFVTLLVVPGNFYVAGLRLTVSRVYMLVVFVPLALRWVTGSAGRITAVDILIALHCFWMGLAMVVVHGKAQIAFLGMNFIELFGSYLIGRTLVRSAADYRTFFRYFLYGLIFLCPFAVVEWLTGRMLLSDILGSVLEMPRKSPGAFARMGFERTMSVFTHPILFGLFCSIGFANVFYIYRGQVLKRMAATWFVAFMTVTAMSSAPLISVFLQFSMITWDRIATFLRARWQMLFYTLFFVLVIAEMLTKDGLIRFIVDNFTFNPKTGFYRMDIWYYAIAEILRHPIFGLGLNDWERAWWMYHGTVDSFWLVTTMRYGVPTIAFLISGIGLNCYLIMSRRGLSEDEGGLRTGHLVASAGLFMALFTVDLWGGIIVFAMAYIGAGAWFYTATGIDAKSARSAQDGRGSATTWRGGTTDDSGSLPGVAAAAPSPTSEQGRGRGAARLPLTRQSPGAEAGRPRPTVRPGRRP